MDEQIEDTATGLWLLNLLRDAVSDQLRHEVQVSAPGEAEPGEFYVTVGRQDYYVVRIEVM